MSVDPVGNVYVVAKRAGSTMEATPGAVSLGNRQVLVMKFDPTGSKLVFAAEFGGSGLRSRERSG